MPDVNDEAELRRHNAELQKRIAELEDAIAERKQAEEELRESEKKYRFLFRNAPDGIILIDAQAIILDCNQIDCEMLGCRREEIIGKHITAFLTKESRDKAKSGFPILQKEGFFEAELSLVRKDGAVFPVWRKVSAIYDEEGKFNGAIAHTRDITTRKQGEQELRELNQAIEQSSEGIAFSDMDGRLIFINQIWAKMHGYRVVNLIGKPLTMLDSPEDIKSFPKIWETIEKRGFWRGELQRVRKNGSSFPAIMTSNLVKDDAGKPIGIVGTCLDITDRKQAEEELRESEEKVRTLYNSSSDAIMLLDEMGFFDCNEATLQLFGCASREEFCSMHPADLSPPLQPDGTDSMSYAKNNIEVALKEGNKRFEHLHRRLDGSDFPAEVLLDAMVLGGKKVLQARVYDITERKQAEEALRESEEKVRTLYNSSSDAIMLLDEKGFFDCNEATLQLFGCASREEFCSMHPADLSPPLQPDGTDSMSYAKNNIEVALKEGNKRFEHLHRRLDGSDFPAEVLLDAMVLGGKKVLQARVYDITDRKKAERALLYRVEFEKLITSISTHFINLEPDEVDSGINRTLQEIGKFTNVDRSYVVMFCDNKTKMDNTHEWCAEGIEPQIDNLQGLPVEVIQWCMERLDRFESISIPRVADLPPEARAEKEILQAQNIQSLIIVPLVYGGSLIGFLGFDSVQGERTWSEDIIALLSIVGDVIANALEHKKAEEEHERLSVAIDQAAETIVITDSEGTIQYVNPAFEQTTGYTRSEAIGRNPRLLKSGEHDDAFYKAMWDTLLRGDVWKGLLINKKKNDMLYTADTVISPVRDASGRTIDYVAVERDITRKLRLEEQLRQAQKMESIGRLAGGVAHDFNNMLGVILGYTQMAMKQANPAEPLHADLMEICSAAERSADLTRQLLAFARKQTVAPRVLDLNETVEGMLKMLRRLIGENVHLAWLPGASLWQVKMDAAQIDQILANLCANARDAIDDMGKVTIETGNATLDEAYCAGHLGFVPGEYVLLVVSDDGCGMDMETLDKIYEPFFTTKETGNGTGLGLSMVYGIVKQNNGFIDVYSELGQGTTLKIYLPRHAARATQMQKEGLAEPAKRGHETILLVEDEPAILKMITRLLEGQGYTVLAASTPGEAIHFAREHGSEIHLIMTDVVMPEMNGRDLVRYILSFYANLKCVFMSGYTADVIAHHGVLEEGVHFIQKPFALEEAAAKVREALDSK